jgi:hypothetical protein
MKKLLISGITAVLLAGVSLAQNAAQPNVGAEAQSTRMQLEPGTIIRAQLAKSVDAKKAKVGDEVTAKTLDDFLSDKDEVLAPRGSRVVAHVAEVSPRKGESQSTLGIAFDKMVLKNGTEVPLKASIQAIGWPESNARAVNQPMEAPGNSGSMSPMPSNNRGGYGAPPPNPGGSMPGNAGNAGTSGTAYPDAASINGELTPKAQGVVGMPGVSLSTGAAQDSLLSSPRHNIKLDGGTQMILRVIP